MSACFPFHDWAAWSDAARHESKFSGAVLLQIRKCKRCNKQKARTVADLERPDDLGDEIGQ